jgi:putative FmdB family regulatory protein
MTYEYRCAACGGNSEREFPIGKAEREVPCPACGGVARKLVSKSGLVFKGGGWPSKSVSLNAEMTRRNEEAGRRMRKEHKPGMRLAALDHGGGDVREVKGGT